MTVRGNLSPLHDRLERNEKMHQENQQVIEKLNSFCKKKTQVYPHLDDTKLNKIINLR